MWQELLQAVKISGQETGRDTFCLEASSSSTVTTRTVQSSWRALDSPSEQRTESCQRGTHSRYSTIAFPSGAIETAPPVSCAKGGRTRTTTFTRSAQASTSTLKRVTYVYVCWQPAVLLRAGSVYSSFVHDHLRYATLTMKDRLGRVTKFHAGCPCSAEDSRYAHLVQHSASSSCFAADARHSTGIFHDLQKHNVVSGSLRFHAVSGSLFAQNCSSRCTLH